LVWLLFVEAQSVVWLCLCLVSTWI